MLQPIQSLYGLAIHASDGPIGQVRDCYFDTLTWSIRYLVADTATWIPGRAILISPESAEREPDEAPLRLHLTRDQIAGSPSVDLHKPVSRQYEEEYYKYYGLAYYWKDDGFVPLEPSTTSAATPADGSAPVPSPAGQRVERVDPHLRSTLAVCGYQVMGSAGTDFGHVTGFLFEPSSWVIQLLVVRSGHRLTGREFLLPARQISAIRYEDSLMITQSTARSPLDLPSYTPGHAGKPDATPRATAAGFHPMAPGALLADA